MEQEGEAMENKIEFTLKPVTGAAASGGGYRAVLTTAKGDAMDGDDVIAEALDRGYIAGVKDVLAKYVVEGVLDSMIAGVLRDGVTRRIGDYLSVSVKVHGRFKDAQEEFDPSRHKLALSLKQLNAFRPTFKGVQATNVNHKRQFRIHSVRSVHGDGKSGRLVFGDEFIIAGADFRPGDSTFGVAFHVKKGLEPVGGFEPPMLSVTENEIRCAWPEEFKGPVGDYYGEIVVGWVENLEDVKNVDYIHRSIRVTIIPSVRNSGGTAKK